MIVMKTTKNVTINQIADLTVSGAEMAGLELLGSASRVIFIPVADFPATDLMNFATALLVEIA